MSIQAILFDLDDTLIVDEAISKSALELTAALAAKLHGADIAQFIADSGKISRALWRENPCAAYCQETGITAEECLWGHFTGESPDLVALRAWAMNFRLALFDAVLRKQGLTGDEEPLAREFSDSRRRLQRLMPDAKETLARLKSTYKIGLLTNGAPDLQREKIATSGLGSFIDAVAVSGEHLIGKPNPEIFHILLNELQVEPKNSVMVGNSLARDILGAQAAGISRTVWIQVPGSEEFAEVTPDHTILGLHELPPFLLRLTNP